LEGGAGKKKFGGVVIRKSANKRLQWTKTARGSFSITARHTCLGGGFAFLLPVRARFWPLNRGVSHLLGIQYKEKGILVDSTMRIGYSSEKDTMLVAKFRTTNGKHMKRFRTVLSVQTKEEDEDHELPELWK
jgi:hypothetical protein